MKLYQALVWALLAVSVAACGRGETRPSPDPVTLPERNARHASDINVKLGVEYMKREQFDVAVRKLRHAINIDPRNSKAYDVLAVLYEQIGEVEKAGEHFTKAIQLDPENAAAHNNYGNFLCRYAQPVQAEQQFLDAARNPLYETPEVAYTNAGICLLRNGDWVKAEMYLEKALLANKRFPVALYQIANLYYEKNWFREAQAYLKRYLEVAEHTPQTLWLGLRIARALDDKDTEASYAVLLKGKYPDSEEARLLRESGVW